ncbi:VWA-like domain-containing protein [Desulfovibrio sp. OttesenSCG-928-A18]|nr:VWA-like domain-containing protein [Desulfovibrio sp. OttesenSCG-928-A18]
MAIKIHDNAANGTPRAEAVRAITRARSCLVMEHPFFAALALRLNLKEDTRCRDLWSDGHSLGYNPIYAATLPEKKLVGALAHEVLHLALGHHMRRKGRDEKLWNRACDYAINQVLLDTGFSLPEGFAIDPFYSGMNVDDIYARLSRLMDNSESHGALSLLDGGAGISGKSGDSERKDGLEAAADQRYDGAPSAQSGEDRRKKAGKTRGGKATGQNGKGGKHAPRTAFTGEVRDLPDLTGGTNNQARQLAEQAADVALNQAMRRALNMGSLPAGLLRLLRRAPLPRLDWRDILRRFLEDCADSDYSWTSPNRRYIHQGIYLPSRREPRIPCIALAVDSSGSVDEAALALFCTELSSVLEEWDTTLNVLFHDTKVQSSQTFCRQDLPVNLTPCGGGGTDYRPVCAFIEEQRLRPSCLIWFTDMQCNRFPEEPSYPVLWVSAETASEAPPFGELISLHN